MIDYNKSLCNGNLSFLGKSNGCCSSKITKIPIEFYGFEDYIFFTKVKVLNLYNVFQNKK